MRDPLLIDLPTRIETERLLMRPPQAGDRAPDGSLRSTCVCARFPPAT